MGTNGVVAEGAVRGFNMGNNAGEGGRWAYYGEVTIALIDGQSLTVDLLDVQQVRDVTEQRRAAYSDAGVIAMVDWFDQLKD